MIDRFALSFLCIELDRNVRTGVTLLYILLWTLRNAERTKIDAFEMWCWRRVMRVSLMERKLMYGCWKTSDTGISGVSTHSGARRQYCITLYFRGRKISRKVNMKYFREKIFSRIYCSRENIFPRKYLPAKITSRENIFSLAKISSRENIFMRFFSVPQICRLVGIGYAV